MKTIRQLLKGVLEPSDFDLTPKQFIKKYCSDPPPGILAHRNGNSVQCRKAKVSYPFNSEGSRLIYEIWQDCPQASIEQKLGDEDRSCISPQAAWAHAVIYLLKSELGFKRGSMGESTWTSIDQCQAAGELIDKE